MRHEGYDNMGVMTIKTVFDSRGLRSFPVRHKAMNFRKLRHATAGTGLFGPAGFDVKLLKRNIYTHPAV